MDPLSLMPTPDVIPAPAWLFVILETFLFTLHLLVINVMLGGMLIIFFSRLKNDSPPLSGRLHDTLASKIPTTFALGINLGVAPLLFLQVIYGHLFYTSSVLMAVYWLLIIPLLILAYYGTYFHIRTYDASPLLSKTALGLAALICLYVMLMFVNNTTLMVQPEKWAAYFGNRNGTILNLSDPTIIPRYLHFVLASVAVAGLFMALAWRFRSGKNAPGTDAKVGQGLKLYGGATLFQMVTGLWFLVAIPREFLLQFMGGNLPATIFFMIAFLSGIGAVAAAFANKLKFTLALFLVTLVAMVITRHHLRGMYLSGKFDPASLSVVPQYDVLALFLAVLAAGLIGVGYMLKLYFDAKAGRGVR